MGRREANVADKDWVRVQLAENSATPAAATERVETSPLTEFHKWASPGPVQRRNVRLILSSHSLALPAFDRETENSIGRDRKIAELDARIRKLEKTS